MLAFRDAAKTYWLCVSFFLSCSSIPVENQKLKVDHHALKVLLTQEVISPDEKLPAYGDSVGRLLLSLVNDSKKTQVFYLSGFNVEGVIRSSSGKIMNCEDMRAIMGMAFPPLKKESFTVLKTGEKTHLMVGDIRRGKTEKNFKINLGLHQEYRDLSPGDYQLVIQIHGLVGDKDLNQQVARDHGTEALPQDELISEEMKFVLK